MALPRLDTPQYDLKLYNGENIKFRPFLVKEQKNSFDGNGRKRQYTHAGQCNEASN